MADPDHHIREGGGGHPDPEIREEGPTLKNFFSHRATVWSKNKGGGPPRPLPWMIRHCNSVQWHIKKFFFVIFKEREITVKASQLMKSFHVIFCVCVGNSLYLPCCKEIEDH